MTAYPVIWNTGEYSGECACGNFIRQGDDCSVTETGETICGSCAMEMRKELENTQQDRKVSMWDAIRAGAGREGIIQPIDDHPSVPHPWQVPYKHLWS